MLSNQNISNGLGDHIVERRGPIIKYPTELGPFDMNNFIDSSNNIIKLDLNNLFIDILYDYRVDNRNKFDDNISQSKISNCGTYLIHGQINGTVSVTNTITKQVNHIFKDHHDGKILSIDISIDNKYIVTGSTDNYSKLISLKTQESTQYKHKAPVTHVAISNHGDQIISASMDGIATVYINDIEFQKEYKHKITILTIFKFEYKIPFRNKILNIFHYAPITSVAINDNIAMTGSLDGSAKVWDFRKMNNIWEYKSESNRPVINVALSVLGTMAIVSDSDDVDTLFDLMTNQKIKSMQGDQDLVHKLFMSKCSFK